MISGTRHPHGAAGSASSYSDLPYLHYREQQSSGTDGGTFTTGSWVTRVLTNEITDTGSIGSLSSNQITLPSGTYQVLASVPGVNCGGHVARLRNITNSATLLAGCPAVNDTFAGHSYSILKGRFTITGTKVIEIQHQCASTRATYGLGYASSTGEIEIYTSIEIWKTS